MAFLCLKQFAIHQDIAILAFNPDHIAMLKMDALLRCLAKSAGHYRPDKPQYRTGLLVNSHELHPPLALLTAHKSLHQQQFFKRGHNQNREVSGILAIANQRNLNRRRSVREEFCTLSK